MYHACERREMHTKLWLEIYVVFYVVYTDMHFNAQEVIQINLQTFIRLVWRVLGGGWRRRPPDVKGSCECAE